MLKLLTRLSELAKLVKYSGRRLGRSLGHHSRRHPFVFCGSIALLINRNFQGSLLPTGPPLHVTLVLCFQLYHKSYRCQHHFQKVFKFPMLLAGRYALQQTG